MSNAQYEVENPEIQELLRDIGHMVGDKMPKGWGFTLLLFSYGEGGSMFYISSANREDMKKALVEMATKLQGGLI